MNDQKLTIRHAVTACKWPVARVLDQLKDERYRP